MCNSTLRLARDLASVHLTGDFAVLHKILAPGGKPVHLLLQLRNLVAVLCLELSLLFQLSLELLNSVLQHLLRGAIFLLLLRRALQQTGVQE